MARMIDADALIKAMGVHTYMQTEWTHATAWGVPIVDAEPVVRCKDCYYCRKYNEMWRFPKLDVLLCTRLYDGDGEEVSAEDYCSRGERKDETD